ncbi:Uma2 family endonuclease [Mucilaginibacter arboris]|uniref:Uma2 family endonuclease n=1 Tax=Mucilaginibacter arboris TaxID=2682090 RepID=A0A7K1SV12_9SPHI|nr:Uma2 family endonuclease [Mucilaginibacter arboris]MVN21078.1 Uma2 family endonuclease [Mucilaginibacter arboris]
MVTAEKKTRYIVEDYMLLEEGAPFQLINYDLIMSPSPNPYHQKISFELSTLLNIFLKSTKNKGYAAAAPLDVYFNDGNVLQPDLIYISEERKAEIVKERIEGAPDLVVEILSPSNAYYDLRQKKDIYEKYGVTEYIIIDPIQQNVEVYVLKDDAYTLDQKVKQPESFHSTILNGFSVDLKDIFEQ